MMLKKFIAAATAAVLAMGIFTVLPESPAVISVSAADSSYTTNDGIVISTDSNGVKYVSGYTGKSKNITIPNGVGYIGSRAFYGNEKIESVTISSSVTEIKDMAFSRCLNLKTVKFAQNSKLTIIREFTFFECLKLTDIVLPNSLTEIERVAFGNCENLTKLTVPADTKIDVNSCFAGLVWLDDGAGLADGKTPWFVWISSDNIIEFTQKPITLYVTKGSDAEKYAKANGIAYKYGSAPAASTTTTNSSNSSKLAAPTGIKATVSEEKIVLKWNSVSGAKAYRVYKYDSKTGKYLKYKDVSGTQCTVKGLKSGTKYSFKVYALTSENGKFVPQTPSKAVAFTTKEYNTDLITL